MLEKVQEKIHEYVCKYRKESLPPIERRKIYGLNKAEKEEGSIKAEVFWPDYWPSESDSGVYALFHSDTLLYIGKASQQPLATRVSGYFKHSDDGTRGVPRQPHYWTKEPTHVVMWTVPKEMFFEASALEEYLIHELGDLPVDNVRGKRKSNQS